MPRTNVNKQSADYIRLFCVMILCSLVLSFFTQRFMQAGIDYSAFSRSLQNITKVYLKSTSLISPTENYDMNVLSAR